MSNSEQRKTHLNVLHRSQRSTQKYLIKLQKIKYNIFEQHNEGNFLSLLLLTDSFFKENATAFISKQSIASLV